MTASTVFAVSELYSRRFFCSPFANGTRVSPPIPTLPLGNNYAVALLIADRFAETKSLMRKIIPVARRVLDEDNHLLLMMRWVYARALYRDPAASLNDLREAVSKLEELARIARRVMGGAHSLTSAIERHLGLARAALRARETPSGSA